MKKVKFNILPGATLVLLCAALAFAIWGCFVRPQAGLVLRILFLAADLCALTLSFLLLSRVKKRYTKQKIMEKQAYTDHATGLPNQARLAELIAALPKNGAGLVYLEVGLEHPEEISRMFGAQVLEAELLRLGIALHGELGHGEHLARLEHGNYAMLLHPGRMDAFAVRIETMFENLCDEKLAPGGAAYDYPRACRGMLYVITGAEAYPEAVIQMVSTALCSQKREAGEAFTMFDPVVLEEMRTRGALRGVAADALRHGEIVPYLQPKYHLNNGRVCGAEVLARWEHPQRGMLLPEDFLTLLEQQNKLPELDWRMLEEACKMERRWTTEQRMPMAISLNFAAQTLYRTDLIDRMLEIVQQYEIPNWLIEVEIPEKEMIAGGDALAAVMTRLRECGFAVSVTGFGARSGSLVLLRDRVVDLVKVDISFFVGPSGRPGKNARVLAQSVIKLLGELGVGVVVEKVETAEQEALLKKIYCETVQGFRFSRPLAPEQFEELIYKNRA